MKTNAYTLFLMLFVGVINAQITEFPYEESFESGAGGWTVQGTFTSWVLGQPNGSVINSAADGDFGWATNLTGNYDNDESGWIESPVFDFSILSNPAVEFSLWWNCEYLYDGAVFQSSIDNGTSWQNVGNYGDNDWFNYFDILSLPGGPSDGWSGRISQGNGSNGWVTVKNELDGLSGQSNVKFRIVFSSDFSIVDEGIGFDFIKIYNDCPASAGEDFFVESQCYDTQENITTFQLNLIDSDATLGGVWSSLDDVPITEDGTINYNDIDENGIYRFLYTVTSEDGLCTDSAVYAIEFIRILSAGEDGVLSACAGVTFDDLFEALNGNPDPGGFWLPNEINGEGVYTYSHDGPCFNPVDNAEVILSLIPPADAGSDTVVDGLQGFGDYNLNNLREQYSGRPFEEVETIFFGTWTFLNGPYFVSVSEDGDVDFPNTGSGAGEIYTFEYTVEGDCGDVATAFLEITILGEDTAGIDGEFYICPNDSFTTGALFDSLGGNPKIFGSWFDPDGNLLDNGAFLNTIGIYTYQVTDNFGDFADESFVTVRTVISAGEDSFVGSQCYDPLDNLTTFQLNLIDLDATVSGVWSSLGDVPITEDGNINYSDIVQNGIYSFLYTVTIEGYGCTDSAEYSIEFIRILSAGEDGLLSACAGVTFDDLFLALGGNPDPGGFWSPSEINGGGVYTYSHNNPCFNPLDSAQVTFEIEVADAGYDTIVEGFQGAGSYNLDSLREQFSGEPYGEAETNDSGTWTLFDGPYSVSISENGDVYFPNNGFSDGEIFTFQYTVEGDCGDLATALLEITILGEDTAGIDGEFYVCPNDSFTTSTLFDSLGGNPKIFGSWFDPDGNLLDNGSSLNVIGIYTYQVTDNFGDFADESFVSVLQEDIKSAGEDGDLVINIGSTVTEEQLFSALNGNPDLGGVWQPELAGAGVYTYYHENLVCEGEESFATVTVTESTLSMDNQLLLNLEVYPNPTKTLVYLKNHERLNIQNIDIIDIQGQLISNVSNNFGIINLENLESTMYFIIVKTLYGQKVFKIIKE